MKLPTKKIEYIDNEAFRLVGLVQKLKKPDKLPDPKGSIGNKIPFDIRDKVAGRPITARKYLFDKAISITICNGEECIGYDEDTYKQYDKFINNIYKDQSINESVSFGFIDSLAIKWIITTYKMSKANSNFSDFLLSNVQESVKEYKIRFPIYYLDFIKEFDIGDVNFDFFTKEQFDLFITNYQKRHPERETNPYLSLKPEYQGKVFCSYTIKAEKDKAKEIALKKCTFAVDILKICSTTLDFPQYKLSFDIDARVRENIENEALIQVVPNFDRFDKDFHILPNHHEIGDKEWQLMFKRNFKIFNQFFLEYKTNHSELEGLIYNAIERLANALSTVDLHQRIVELFTVFESLLLKDQDSPIIDSVTKYCSKLVTKNPIDRKTIIVLLKEMYKIRSAIIHHGVKKEFETEDLRKLQSITNHLIFKLIKMTKKHATKKSILEEIDNAILEAY